ncbi:MAG: MucB/RseB C-terminal domain-containing protein, partial [Rhodoferax sp.]
MHRLRAFGVALRLAAVLGAAALVAPGVPAQALPGSDITINTWLLRAHEASRYRAYAGTFVVSAGSSLSSARIWHVCQGDQQVERVESLSGTPRATFRRNDQVVTFFPESRVAVIETRESLGAFPGLLKSSDSDISDYYQLQRGGSERIAGFESEMVQLVPSDNWRYGYRVWSEKRTGLVMQMQTLDLDGRVLEQSAFSELQLDAPVSIGRLHQLMGRTEGYRVVSPEVQKTRLDDQGWGLQKLIVGFKPMGCYKRPTGQSARAGHIIQWVLSDGLATVSLFVEPFDAQRHLREGYTDLGGATHTQTRRIEDWWATAVGEAPAATLS